MKMIRILVLKDVYVHEKENYISYMNPDDVYGFHSDVTSEIKEPTFKTERYKIKDYVHSKTKDKLSFAMTDEQSMFFKEYIWNEEFSYIINLYKDREYMCENQINIIDNKYSELKEYSHKLYLELEKYKNMGFIDKIKFLFSKKKEIEIE